METDRRFIKLRMNVYAVWEGFPPEYRIFINDEMFVERTFKLDDSFYISEILQIYAQPGVYTIHLEELKPKTGNILVSRPTIDLGDATVLGQTKFEIHK